MCRYIAKCGIAGSNPEKFTQNVSGQKDLTEPLGRWTL